MSELDEGQRKELDAQIAANMWPGRSVPMRLLMAVALVAPTSLVLSGLGYLATDRWFPTGALITGFVFIWFPPPRLSSRVVPATDVWALHRLGRGCRQAQNGAMIRATAGRGSSRR